MVCWDMLPTRGLELMLAFMSVSMTPDWMTLQRMRRAIAHNAESRRALDLHPAGWSSGEPAGDARVRRGSPLLSFLPIRTHRLHAPERPMPPPSSITVVLARF